MIFNILVFLIMAAVFLVIAVPLLILKGIRNRCTTSGENGKWKRGWVDPKKRVGDVTVSGTKPSSEDKIVGDNIGEYVEYEEVDSNGKKDKN